MIKALIRNTAFYTYLKFFRRRFFPSHSQLEEDRQIPAKMSFYGQFIRPGALCFDVGANIGNRTEVFLKLGARVVAVEPQKDCARMLRIRFGKKITLINKALGDAVKTGVLFKSDSSEISSMSRDWIDAVSKSRFSTRKWDRRESVSMATLDSLISLYGLPDFCKIDVEGFEREVLSGLSKPIPCLSFEYTIPERLDSIGNCFHELQRIGEFECNYTTGESMELVLSHWISPGEMMTTMERISKETLFGDIYVRFKNRVAS